MALIPGSYARAAGLQSEINKVTVTRVAGSEVQFRRAIDTYRRDLRYHVNHIQREQKQLRRSMQGYYKKLRDSKKQREQRKAQLQEETKKATELKQPKEPKVLHLPDIVGTGHEKADEMNASTGDSKTAAGSGGEGEVMPDSPDSGIGVDTEGDIMSTLSPEENDPAGPHKCGDPKVFLTSTRSKPYFKAKRGQKDNPRSNGKKAGQQGHSYGTEPAGSAKETGDDQLLPSIAEEGEEDGDHTKDSSTKVTFDLSTDSRNSVEGAAKNTEADSKHSEEERKTLKAKPAVQPIAMITINTKPASKLGGAGGEAASDTLADKNSSAHLDTSVTTTSFARRKQRRKTGVSFGDLIKLQHTPTSSTKQLFSLVDRLASVHGIVDPPPQNVVSMSSSLDPRTNIKIKRRGDGPQSQMSNEIVKQAAVLYSMKYGYNVPEDLIQPADHVLQEHWDDLRAGEEGAGLDREGYESDRTEGTELAASRKKSRTDSSEAAALRRNSTAVSIRLDSRGDMISTYYAFSGVESSLANEDTGAVMATYSQLPDTRESRASRGRQRQKLSMSELSEHVSRIKSQPADRRNSNPVVPQPRASRSQSTSRAINGVAQTVHDTLSPEPQSRQTLSPLPQRSRSLSRSRRESVSSQLQERLSEQDDKGVAWQSAFGRLKMLHTLVDLSPYFHRD